MADKIKILIEEMRIDLLNLMKKQIFTREEIKSILSIRENLEYSLTKKSCKAKDFLKAIQYEYDLEKLRRQRKKQANIQKRDTYRDFAIIRRIIQLYDRLTQKYRFNIPLLKQYLTFCYKIHSKKHFFKAISHSLASNPANLELWLLAVYYEFEVLQNPFKARHMFLKALKINGRNFEFWQAYFLFELRVFALISQRRKLLKGPSNSMVEEREDLTKSVKDRDFISFGENQQQNQDISSYNLASQDDEKSLQLIKIVYETCKEKFSRKNASFFCLKALKDEKLIDEDALKEFKGEILKELEEETRNDENIAFKAYQENFGIDFIGTLKKLQGDSKAFRAFLTDLFKKQEEIPSEILDVLREKEALHAILQGSSEELREFLVNGLLKHKNCAKAALFLECVEKELENLIFKEKKSMFFDSYLEILNFNSDNGNKITENTLKTMITLLRNRSFNSSLSKISLENSLFSLIKLCKYLLQRQNINEKHQKNLIEELFSLGKEAFLLFQRPFSSFMKELLAVCKEIQENELHQTILQRLVSLKRGCPIEIWLIYLEHEQLTSKEKQSIFRFLEDWWPESREILEKHIEFQEKSGQFIELQRLLAKKAALN